MKYKQLAAQYKQELEQLKQAHELEIKRMTEEIEALKRKDTAEGTKNSSESEKAFPDTPPPDLTDTSLTLPEAIRKYHAPEESTKYSVTLWGGAHFEGVRACMNENCVNKGGKIPVGELEFWINRWANNSWFFFCSRECKTEVYNVWYAKTHPKDTQANKEESYKLSVGYTIRQIRLGQRETQAQFAERFKVSPTMVSLWETNKATPPQEVREWLSVPGSLTTS